jgi:tetratricopeptide (TPR) repeat protein
MQLISRDIFACSIISGQGHRMTAADSKLRNPRQALRLLNSLRGPAYANYDAILDQAIDLWPQDLQLRIACGHRALVRDDRFAARRHFEMACKDHPRAVLPRLFLADLLRQMSSPDLALTYLNEALELRPQSGQILRQIVNLLFELSRVTEAEPYILRMLELLPDHPPLLLELTRVYMTTKRDAEAEKTLRYILAREPKHIAATGELAFLLVLMDRYSEAETVLRNAIADDPDLWMYHRMLGGLLADTCRHEEAEPILRAVLERDPRNIPVLAKLAKVCSATDRQEEAREFALKALDPTQLIAAELLQAIIVPKLTAAVHAEIATAERIRAGTSQAMLH